MASRINVRYYVLVRLREFRLQSNKTSRTFFYETANNTFKNTPRITRGAFFFFFFAKEGEPPNMCDQEDILGILS